MFAKVAKRFRMAVHLIWWCSFCFGNRQLTTPPSLCSKDCTSWELMNYLEEQGWQVALHRGRTAPYAADGHHMSRMLAGTYIDAGGWATTFRASGLCLGHTLNYENHLFIHCK
jgi:hypothetical protein